MSHVPRFLKFEDVGLTKKCEGNEVREGLERDTPLRTRNSFKRD